MWFRCKHDWVKIAEQVLPSAYEQMIERNPNGISGKMKGTGIFTQKYILVLKCQKCPKLKTIIEENG